MLFILLSALIIIPALMSWGKFLENFLGKGFAGISGSFFSGLMFTGILFTLISFFLPLNIFVEIPVLGIGFILFLKHLSNWKSFQFSSERLVIFVFFTGFILFLSSNHPFILDHFGYYIPTINWLKEHGLIKGISNLDLTLGQMSFWHIIQAGFSNFSDTYFKLNALLLIAYTWYILENKSWVHLIFIPGLVVFSQSPSPDLPAIIFSLIILNEIFLEQKNWRYIMAFAVFSFCIKPTVIWLPLFVFLCMLYEKKSGKNYILGAFILILFCLKNLWAFGFPVFPLDFPDLKIVWQPNPQILQASSEFALVKTYDEKFLYHQILNFSVIDYVKNWLFIGGIKSIINCSFIVVLFLLILLSFIRKEKKIYFLVFSVVIKSTLILYFSAQYRFFLDVFFVFAFLLFYKYFKPKISLIISFIMMFFCGILFSVPGVLQKAVPSFNLGNFITPFEWSQLKKPAVYRYGKYDTFKVGNLKFNVSKNYPFNFDTPLPSISEQYIFDYRKAGVFPQPIDIKNLKKGFIWKKLSPEEKKQLDQVIETIKNNYRNPAL